MAHVVLNRIIDPNELTQIHIRPSKKTGSALIKLTLIFWLSILIRIWIRISALAWNLDAQPKPGLKSGCATRPLDPDAQPGPWIRIRNPALGSGSATRPWDQDSQPGPWIRIRHPALGSGSATRPWDQDPQPDSRIRIRNPTLAWNAANQSQLHLQETKWKHVLEDVPKAQFT